MRSVTTDSTHPPKAFSPRKPHQLRVPLASKKVSPKGVASSLRMLTGFIHRGRGRRRLSFSDRRELQIAKSLLSKRLEREKQSKSQSRAS